MKFILDYYYKKTNGFYPFFKYCPKKYKMHYLKQRYFDGVGEYPDFENPKTLNEKIWWLLFNEDLTLKTQLTDKLLVKDWVKEKIGEEYVAKTYGIWDKFDEIDFEKLPEQFALKTNHGWRMQVFISNKDVILSRFKKELKNRFDNWIKINYEDFSLEPQYRNIKRKIYAEELTLDLNKKQIIQEFQFYCLNGKPLFLEQITPTRDKKFSETYYDMNYEKENFAVSKEILENKENQPIKTKHFEKMKELASILCKNFQFVRVDFREFGDRIIFAEMTFSPCSGMRKFYPDNVNYEFGEKLILPKKI